MNAHHYRTIRTIQLHKGYIAAMKWIRTNIVPDLMRAKLVHSDVIGNQPWTMPHITAELVADKMEPTYRNRRK
jgi:hypothetical protein